MTTQNIPISGHYNNKEKTPWLGNSKTSVELQVGDEVKVLTAFGIFKGTIQRIADRKVLIHSENCSFHSIPADRCVKI